MDFYASRLPYRSSEEERAYREGLGALPAQATWMAGLMAPSAGLSDYFGYYPEMPTAEQPIPTEYLPSFAENIENKRYMDALYQGLGVLGDVAYASTPVTGMMGPLVGATLKAGSGIGKATKGTKGTKGGLESLPESARVADELKIKRDELMNQYGRYVPYGEAYMGYLDLQSVGGSVGEMYSPSLEALIYKAPPNLKGKQISEWLKGNTNKGVKPKELEFLDIDKITETYPDITIPELLNEVQPVKVSKRYYEDQTDFRFEYDVDEPTRDPLDESYVLYDNIIEDINYDIEKEDFFGLPQDLADYYESTRGIDNISTDLNEPSYPRMIEQIKKDQASGKRTETLDEIIEEFAEGLYAQNPYEKLTPRNVGDNDFPIDYDTFAFGNEDVGYRLFVRGEDVTDTNNIAYSPTEAQIQLQRAMGADDPDMYTGGGTMYKQYIDENLPGGSNYQEVVFKWDDAPDGGHGVYMTHFDDENQIAHALIRDRILEDGSSTKHIDELQSDLHKEGSRNGYIGDNKYMENLGLIDDNTYEIKKKANELFDLYEAELDALDDLTQNRLNDEDVPVSYLKKEIEYAKRRFSQRAENNSSFLRDSFRDIEVTLQNIGTELVSVGKQLRPETKNKYESLIGDMVELAASGDRIRLKVRNAVPNTPYKDDWYKMGIKNLLLDAIDEGKDAISISRSDAMIDRYTDDYETFYETLYDKKIPSFMKKLANQYGGKFKKGSLDLEDVYGKGMAELGEKQGTYLRYGREGKDPMIFENLDKFEATIIEITPEMKAKILEEGLPTFKRGGEVRSSLYDIDIFGAEMR